MRIELHRSAPCLHAEPDSAKPAASQPARPEDNRSQSLLEWLVAGFLDLLLTAMWCGIYAGLLLASWGVALIAVSVVWVCVVMPVVEVWHRW